MQVPLQQVDAQVKSPWLPSAPSVGPAGLGCRPSPSSCPSPILCHTLSLSQVSSPGVDFGSLMVKQAALGGSPEGVSREGQILEWGGAALADLGV